MHEWVFLRSASSSSSCTRWKPSFPESCCSHNRSPLRVLSTKTSFLSSLLKAHPPRPTLPGHLVLLETPRQACPSERLCPGPRSPAARLEPGLGQEGSGCRPLSQVPRAMPCTLGAPSKHWLAGCSGAQLTSARLFICTQKCEDRWGKGAVEENSLEPKPK